MKRGTVHLRSALLGITLGVVVGVAGLAVVVPATRARRSPPPTATAPANSPRVTERKTVAPVAPQFTVDLVQLNTLLLAGAERIPGNVAVHVRIDGGGYAGVHSDEAMPAASLIKVPIMVVLLDAWKSGVLNRTPRDEESLRQAITVSDNPSADWLIDRLGTSQINTWLEDHGYRRSRLRHKLLGPRPDGPNVVTAEDLTKMLLELANGSLISPEASSAMRALLLAQTRRTRIPAGLPGTATAGNKTGTLRGIVNDAAFVETPDGRRYAIAVLVSGAGSDEATSRAIARLSTEVYELIASAPAVK